MQRDMARSARQSTGPEVDSETKTAPRKPTGVKRAKVWSPPVENGRPRHELGVLKCACLNSRAFSLTGVRPGRLMTSSISNARDGVA